MTAVTRRTVVTFDFITISFADAKLELYDDKDSQFTSCNKAQQMYRQST